MLKSMQETLEYGFDVLNRVYFGGGLPPVVITIMSSKRTYGHFTVGRVWKAEEGRFNEINISAEHLDRGIEEIMATLCHEMVHFHCQVNGIADTSQNGRYHNANFKREAEARGLLIGYEKYIGYSVTTPSSEFIKVLEENGVEKPMEINRDGAVYMPGTDGGHSGTDGGQEGGSGKNIGGGGKRKTSTRKYICPCCGNSFRATKDIRVMCMDCCTEFVKA